MRKYADIWFYDGFGRQCVANAQDNDLWLGMQKKNSAVICTEEHMKLSRESVAALLPYLEYFVLTGDLPYRPQRISWVKKLIYRLVHIKYRIGSLKGMNLNTIQERIYHE